MKKLIYILLLTIAALNTYAQHTPVTVKYTVKVPGSGGGAGAVSSVFGRTGTVTAQLGDYSSFYQPLGTYLIPSDTVNKALRPIAGTNITITGTFPNLTFNSTNSGGTVTSVGLTSSDITVGGTASPITTSGTYTLTLPTVNSNIGTFNNITINSKGLATAGSNVSYLTGNQTITLTGDVTGSGATSIATTLATVNSNVGTFNNITINGKGLATSASNVTYITPADTVTAKWLKKADSILYATPYVNSKNYLGKRQIDSTKFIDTSGLKKDSVGFYNVGSPYTFSVVHGDIDISNEVGILPPIVAAGTCNSCTFNSKGQVVGGTVNAYPIAFRGTASGTGSATTISIPHGLTGVTATSICVVMGANAASVGISYVTTDATNVNIIFGVAPASGTNNLTFNIIIKP